MPFRQERTKISFVPNSLISLASVICSLALSNVWSKNSIERTNLHKKWPPNLATILRLFSDLPFLTATEAGVDGDEGGGIVVR